MAKKYLPLIRITTPTDSRVHLVDRSRFTLGRSPESEVILLSTSVSRKHLLVELKDDQIFIEDLQTPNGTFLNDAKLEAKQKYPVLPGAVIRLGTSVETLTVDIIDRPVEFEKFQDYLPQFNQNIQNVIIAALKAPPPVAAAAIAKPVPEAPKTAESVKAAEELRQKAEKEAQEIVRTAKEVAASEAQALQLRAQEQLKKYGSEKLAQINEDLLRKREEGLQKLNQEMLEKRQALLDQIPQSARESLHNLKVQAQIEADQILQTAHSEASRLRQQSLAESEVQKIEILRKNKALLDQAEIEASKIVSEGRDVAEQMRQKSRVDTDELLEKTRLQCQNLIKTSEAAAQELQQSAQSRAQQIVQFQQIETEKILKDLKNQIEADGRAQLEKAKTLATAENLQLRKTVEAEISQSREIFEKKMAADLKASEEKIMQLHEASEQKIRQLEEASTQKMAQQEKTSNQKIEQQEMASSQKIEQREKAAETAYQKIKTETDQLTAEKMKLIQAIEVDSKIHADLQSTSKALQESTRALREENKKQTQLSEDLAQAEAKLKSLELAGAQQAQKNSETEHDLELLKTRTFEELAKARKDEQKKVTSLLTHRAMDLSVRIEKVIVSEINKLLPEALEGAKLHSVSQKVGQELKELFASETHIDDSSDLIQKRETSAPKRLTEKAWFRWTAAAVVIAAVVGLIRLSPETVKQQVQFTEGLIEKQKEDNQYKPAMSKDYRQTYTDNILFMNQYVDMKMDSHIQDEWALNLNEFFVKDLKLSEESMVRFIGLESALIKRLVALRGSIEMKYLEEGLARMRDAEMGEKEKILALLKTEKNYERLRLREKIFLSQVKPVPLRIPAESKAPKK